MKVSIEFSPAVRSQHIWLECVSRDDFELIIQLKSS